jgi:hypothetical protein
VVDLMGCVISVEKTFEKRSWAELFMGFAVFAVQKCLHFSKTLTMIN